MREAACETILIGFHHCERIRGAGVGGGRDLIRAHLLAGADAVVMREAGAREKRLDTSVLAAIAVRARQLLGAWPCERIVAPFACDAIASRDDPPIDHDSGAHSGPEDDAEHHRGVARGTIDGFRKRKTVRVIFDTYRAAEFRLKIAVKRASIERNAVGIFDEPGARRDRARRADADRTLLTDAFFDR